MLEEYRDIISKLKQEDAHFAKQFEKHNALDDELDNKSDLLTDSEIEQKKKEKLALKDAIYAKILEYKKEHNL
ncbi:MAG: hypothetical protein DSZ06_04465 [Sulfurospirillum sp.]|nr:MAG: hypothetical protein DSZ06_04465 [Sulfurospirillum sp.]